MLMPIHETPMGHWIPQMGTQNHDRSWKEPWTPLQVMLHDFGWRMCWGGGAQRRKFYRTPWIKSHKMATPLWLQAVGQPRRRKFYPSPFVKRHEMALAGRFKPPKGSQSTNHNERYHVLVSGQAKHVRAAKSAEASQLYPADSGIRT